MVFPNKLAKLMSLRILLISAALTYKNAKIVLPLRAVSQEMSEIVGLNISIMYGKSLSMESLLELIK
jgi:hypothetical protein